VLWPSAISCSTCRSRAVRIANTDAVVGDLDVEVVAGGAHADLDLRGASVFERVDEQLAYALEQRDAQVGAIAADLSFGAHRHRETVLVPELVGEPLERGQQADLVQHGRADLGGQRARRADRAVEQGQDAGDVLVEAAEDRVALQAADLRLHEHERLPDLVVQVGGDRAPRRVELGAQQREQVRSRRPVVGRTPRRAVARGHGPQS
jgi:hypothetical protein